MNIMGRKVGQAGGLRRTVRRPVELRRERVEARLNQLLKPAHARNDDQFRHIVCSARVVSLQRWIAITHAE